MAGTRTAPTVDGSFNRLTVSMHLIDASNDKRAVSLDAPVGTTPALIEALAAALQAATNASLWQVTVGQRYTGSALATNAVAVTYQSVKDNVVLNCKDIVANKQQSAFLPAVVGTIVPEGDVVDIAQPLYTAWRDATLGVLGGDYDAVSARFTERVDRNQAVPAQ